MGGTFLLRQVVQFYSAVYKLDCIQETIAYSIYRIREIADSWIGIEKLPNEIFLPAVLKEIREKVSEFIKTELVLGSRIIKPLVGFGLLECRYKGKKFLSQIDKVRKTKLFDRFVVREW